MIDIESHPKINEDLTSVFARQKKQAFLQKSESLKYRIDRLKRLEQWILGNLDQIGEATNKDLGKSKVESDVTEAYIVVNEIRFALKNLRRWCRPLKVKTPITLFPAKASIQFEPKGVCLILAPWNFPFNLCIGPLAHALAAGNTAIIKPSEHTPYTSEMISKMVKELFTEDEVTVVLGGQEVAQQLLALHFDHIFFTGSVAVGKLIMKAAAEHLTSVTLELGGKSPTLVDSSANLKDAAQKIVVGKFMNCGQTCIAPDYIVVEESVRTQFIEALKIEIERIYKHDAANVDSSYPDYGRIVHPNHHKRLQALLVDAIDKGANVAFGGERNESELFFEPTLLTNVNWDMEVMKEEIFGPILPIVSYTNLSEVLSTISVLPTPLVVYIFSKNRKNIKQVSMQLRSGAVSINDVAFYFVHHGLPFGGQDESGMGRSHGFSGFKAFSNERAIMKQSDGYTSEKMLYPPYKKWTKYIVKILLKYL